MKLKENGTSYYYDARKLPVHFVAISCSKITKINRTGLLEYVPLGGSEWVSSIVVFRKSDGDIRICGYYKIGVNNKVR